MLLIHDHEAEILEGNRLGKQRVCAEEQVHPAGPERLQEKTAGLSGDGAGKKRHAHTQRLEQAGGVLRVLPGKQLRGSEERGLLPAADNEHDGQQGNEGLAASHVSLQEPRHWNPRHEVRFDLGHDTDLIFGERKWQPRDQRFPQARLGDARARAGSSQCPLAAQDGGLEVEQLFVGERCPGLVRLSARAREVHDPERVSRNGKMPLFQDVRGKRRLDGGRQVGDGSQHELSKRGLRQTFSQRVHGEDPAESGGLLAPGLQLEIGALQLTPPRVKASPDVKLPSRHQHPAEKGAAETEERCLAALVRDQGFQRPRTAPSHVGRADHADHHCCLLQARRLGKRYHCRAILVPAREKEEQVAQRHHSQPLQPLRERRAHAVNRGNLSRQLDKEHRPPAPVMTAIRMGSSRTSG